MAAARWLGSIILVLIIAFGLFAGFYWFFPEQYQRIFSGEQQGPPEELVRSVESLEESLRDAGLSGEEIRRVMEQIDLRVLTNLLEEGVQKGVETGGDFFDLMKERIDFSGVDTETVRRAFQERTRDIDFGEALRKLGQSAEKGLEALAEMIRSGTSR